MLQLSYILLFVLLIAVILSSYNLVLKNAGFSNPLKMKKIAIVPVMILAWLSLQFFISKTPFYYNLSMPPRIPLFMILPLIIFTGVFLYRNRNSSMFRFLPVHIPIFYQSFRVIIEVLFYFTFLEDILPIQVTFEGANYDVLLGISAIFMGIYALRKNASKKILIIWNVIGIGVVAFAAFTFVTSFYFPAIWGQEESNISLEFNQFPFLLLPLFFMPSAIFVHGLSIKQLIKLRKDEK